MHCTYIRDGKACGAPTYQNPCAACQSWARSIQEQRHPQPLARTAYPVSPSQLPIVNLMRYPKFRAIHALFHHLWTKNVGGNLYDKKEWEELEAAIEDIARNGIANPFEKAREENHSGQHDNDRTVSALPPLPPSPLPPDLMSPIIVDKETQD